MAPEFASNVAHCDHIPVSLIKLRPRVKLSTRTTHILCSHRLAHLVFKMWHVRTLDALVGEYDCEQDTDDEMPGLGYSSGEHLGYQSVHLGYISSTSGVHLHTFGD